MLGISKRHTPQELEQLEELPNNDLISVDTPIFKLKHSNNN